METIIVIAVIVVLLFLGIDAQPDNKWSDNQPLSIRRATIDGKTTLVEPLPPPIPDITTDITTIAVTSICFKRTAMGVVTGTFTYTSCDSKGNILSTEVLYLEPKYYSNLK